MNMKLDHRLILCDVCGSNKVRGVVLKLKNRTIWICSECQSYSILDKVRVHGGFTIVPVRSASFQRALKDLTYIRPWQRGATHNAFLAFYYEGAVSYVGKLRSIEVKVSRDEVSYLLPSMETWGKKKFYTIYNLKWVDELEEPIQRNHCSPVQSKLTVPFKKFLKAKTVCDLR